ncbi:MAG: hypothetical protein N2689_08485 [Verrucomicrobiae bacterium]|nr:hypothetical protein [Verrucomicrobiae bacterium]
MTRDSHSQIGEPVAIHPMTDAFGGLDDLHVRRALLSLPENRVRRTRSTQCDGDPCLAEWHISAG